MLFNLDFKDMLLALSVEKIDFLIGDVHLWVIGRADLIVNKRACGRPKDIADVQSLDQGDS